WRRPYPSNSETTTSDQPLGRKIGWVDVDMEAGTAKGVYLLPEESYAVAQALARDIGEPLTVSPRTLHKRLHEQGHLVDVDRGRETLRVRRTLEGARRDVLAIIGPSLVTKPDQPDQPDRHAQTG